MNKKPKKSAKPRNQATEDLLTAMAELESYADQGMTMDDIVAHYRKHHPDRIRTVSKVTINTAGKHTPASIKQLRLGLEISQAIFAQGLGVSTVLVQGWEQGVREPSPLARRLLDIVSRDPAAWLASVTPASKGRRAG
jgi:DNA-binding transcriptional regulator YiaG